MWLVVNKVWDTSELVSGLNTCIQYSVMCWWYLKRGTISTISLECYFSLIRTKLCNPCTRRVHSVYTAYTLNESRTDDYRLAFRATLLRGTTWGWSFSHRVVVPTPSLELLRRELSGCCSLLQHPRAAMTEGELLPSPWVLRLWREERKWKKKMDGGKEMSGDKVCCLGSTICCHWCRWGTQRVWYFRWRHMSAPEW
jgi:hypothetical protein